MATRTSKGPGAMPRETRPLKGGVQGLRQSDVHSFVMAGHKVQGGHRQREDAAARARPAQRSAVERIRLVQVGLGMWRAVH
jgi:hypothetical protein